MARGIPSLTGVRGAAALWVVAYHLRHTRAGDGVAADGRAPGV